MAKSKKLAQRARSAVSTSSVRIFQIFYEDWHKQLLDPAFEPYDNRGVQSELQEFAVFEKIARSEKVRSAKFWGAVSWRFTEKSGLTGKAWLEAIDAHPGHDVYYCNPFAGNEALFHNVWSQGEPSHPSFLTIARAFFEAAGLPLERLTAIQPSRTFSAANYFAGTSSFWKGYLNFTRRALETAEANMPPHIKVALHSGGADPQGFHHRATYVPFIVERLFETYLATEGAGLKAFKVPLPEREKALNVHQRLLREMKDVAHKTNSKWLAACWVNYRNLYLYQTNGREWCDKYLRSITPADVQFG